MTGVGAEDFFQNRKKISSPKAKMCGRLQTLTLIMAINFIPQLRYPRANCHHINCTAHKKRTVGLSFEVNSIIRYECMPRAALRQLLSNLRVEVCIKYKPINHLEKLSSFKDTIIDHRSNVFDKDGTVKPWKANGLAILL